MIDRIMKSTRDFVQILLLLVMLLLLFKLFDVPSFEDIQDWRDYRTAIAHIERKETSLIQKIERQVWSILNWDRLNDEDTAIYLLCKLAKKGSEEAELLLLIYDMSPSECARKITTLKEKGAL